MGIDRELWEKKFTDKEFSPWICPTCFKGVLKPEKNTFLFRETYHSKAAHGCDGWEPEWIILKCAGILKCSNPDCREVVSIVGEGSVEERLSYDFQGNTVSDIIHSFTPKYFDPPLFPFQLPKKCPDDVQEMIVDSFRLFLSDPDSAGNKIRIAIERLLTNQIIPKSKKSKNKRVMRSLHERINLYDRKNSEIAEMLMAIKWLGNVGSHDGKSLTLKTILDAYEIIEHVLEELYSLKKKRIKKLVRGIKKAK